MKTEPNVAPDDDIIEQKTFIPLIDADANVIARRLANKSWEDRERFFHNITSVSLDVTAKLAKELFLDQPDTTAIEFFSQVYVGMHQQIADVLEIWDEPMPPDPVAARLYALSIFLC